MAYAVYIYIASYIYIYILHTANMAMGYYNRLLMGYYYNILEYIPANVQTWTGVVKEIFFDKTLAGIFVFFFSNLHSKNVSLQEILQLSQNSNRSKTKSKYQRPLENFFITPLVPWKFHFFFILPLQFPYANACSVFIQYTPVLKKFHFSTNEPPVWIFSGTDDWPYQSNA